MSAWLDAWHMQLCSASVGENNNKRDQLEIKLEKYIKEKLLSSTVVLSGG